MDRLGKQLRFIHEIDKVKGIVRKTRLFHANRYENDAEHSWHICMMAVILSEYANEEIDMLKILKMMLMHDLVEIDTDDKIVYSKTEEDSLAEAMAAERIFGLLPKDQKREYHDLWIEFEKQETPEAKFAMSLDRMEPLLQNLYRNGEDWRKNGISYDQVMGVNEKIGKGSDTLWDHIRGEIEKCMKGGGFNE